MSTHKPENTSLQAQSAKRMVFVTLQAGCLTIVVAGLALLVGLWLDSRLGTGPRWTLILLIASAPFSLGGVVLLVQRALRRLRGEGEAGEDVGEGSDDVLER